MMANNHENVNETSEIKQMNDDGKKTKHKTEIKERKPKIRLIPIWLRLILVMLLLALSLVAGAMIGYGVIGEGSPGDVFKKETWMKISDIVKKETE
ncbi:DNA-directed RNA polymerase subunit beta [Guptibacillus algicola]|uniref:DNA-directed RNA polymerase subunit beta n=1 Tax=Guptibacillus algicola TaxID=225844 RepID=UPI001CD57CD2|nr:DNA-directed RNA polymerase subunit beta [Alkalihalobacillus algicola]MCA0987116.1 DNA-directed RNA polymerase subunit beta [Alkalihalobacillus algicola]